MPFKQGNKLGGRRRDDDWLLGIARKYCPDAFNVLIDNLKADDPAIRQKAAEAIINRGYGKPKEQVTMEMSGGMTWTVNVQGRVKQ